MSSSDVPAPPSASAAPGLTAGVQGTQDSIGAFGAQPRYGMQAMNQGFGNMSQGFGATGFNPAGATNAANATWGASSALPGMANTIWNQAQDPQRAGYNQAMHSADATAMAGLSGSGVADTPYGASVRGTVAGNTDLSWQNYRNQQLQQGGQAAGGLLQQYGGMQGLGSEIARMAPQEQQALLSSLTQGGNAALAPYQQMIQSYLGIGNLGSSVYGTQVGGYGAQQSAQAQSDAAAAQGWGGLGNFVGGAFGGNGMFGSKGAFSGMFG